MDFIDSVRNEFFFLVNNKKEITEILGKPNSFFQLPFGMVTNSLDELLRKEVKSTIYQLIQDFSQDPERERKTPILPFHWDGKDHFYQFRIFSIGQAKSLNQKPANYAIQAIQFDWEDFTPIHNFSHEPSYSKEAKLKISQLEKEIEKLQEERNQRKEELQSLSQKYRELNEEFHRACLNYQRLNEQLETSNEELRVSNEELQNAYAEVTTLNSQLQLKESELRRKEETLRAMIDNVPGVIFSAMFASPEKFIFSYISPKIESEFRIPLHKAYDYGDRSLPIHPEDEVSVRHAIFKSFHNGKPLHLKGRFLYEDDTIEYWECFATVTKKENSFVIMDGVLLNKTKEVLQEKYTQELQIEFHDTINQAIGAVYKLRRRDDGEFIYVFNDGFIAKELGLNTELVKDKTLVEVLGEEEGSKFRIQCEKAFQEGPYETELHYKNRYYYSRAFPYYENGTKAGIIGSAIDITEKKLLEKRLSHTQKLEMIGFLAGGIAHDLNNMLQPILIYGNMLLESLEKGENPSYLDKIQRILSSTQKAKKLVSQILDFSRAKRTSSQVLPLLSPASCLEENLNLFLIDIPPHISVEKKINLPDTLRIPIEEEKFTQILMNLIHNAIDAMKSKSDGTLRIHAYPVETLPEEWNSDLKPTTTKGFILKVEDTGKGIEEEKLSRIFEPFFTEKSFSEGLGLGLSIVRGIIAGMGGSIFVKSKLGEGTCFSVFFPERVGEWEVSDQLTDQQFLDSHSEPLGNQPTQFTSNQKVVIIEDDDFTREAIEDLFKLKKYSYMSFKNPREGIEYLKNSKSEDIQLLITDYKMPDITGVELIQEVRKSHPHLPTILYSGNVLPISEEFIQENQVALLEKPIEPDTLFHTIRNLTQKKE